MNCQKCRTPLRLDESLQNLNPAAFDLLVGQDKKAREDGGLGSRPVYPTERKDKYDDASQPAGSPLVKQSMPPARRGIAPPPTAAQRAAMKDNTAMSFVMLTESQVRPSALTANDKRTGLKKENPTSASFTLGTESQNRPLSSRLESHTRLFEVLSSRCDIDHPVCTDCTDLLLSSFQSRLSASVKERDAYIGFLKGLKNSVPTTAEVAKAEKDLTEATAVEETVFAELLDLEKEKAALDEELADLDAESRDLDVGEKEYWQSRNAFDLKFSGLRDSCEALKASSMHDMQQLERLERTNVYNDAFFISHDGPFGTINGLRLGRMAPPNNVEWPEINAAWGATALLLATVAERLGFTFRGYIIKPMGSTTHIEKVEVVQPESATSQATSARGSSRGNTKTASLELFSSGDLPLGRQILHRRFNEAMVAFLECLRQLCDHTRATSRKSGQSTALPPYKIERDKLNGVSIKLGVSQDEGWTTACKYTLTCCKYLLAHISNIS